MKLKVGVLYGGKSAEHDVSIASAKNIVNAMDREKYDIQLIKISKDGVWYWQKGVQNPTEETTENDENILSNDGLSAGDLVKIGNKLDIKSLDVIFPIIHGTYGEDGSLQGFLEMLDLPYVGPGILGSSVGMDKDLSKRLLIEAGIRVADSMTLYKWREQQPTYEEVTKKLGTPVFMKPCNAGSSVGVSKVRNAAEYDEALIEAFRFDTKILIEAFIDGREIECAVLGNEYPKASVLGEILPTQDFYSYDAKYNDESSKTQLPANIPADLTDEIREAAIKIFQILACEGMARVDFFLRGKEYFLNEINTIPGFTNISMYPQLWAYSGISQTELMDELINLAIARAERKGKLQFVM
ncbi:MAG: D-alanine--D-alanine ligase family protein [Saprospiraceae bacterium]